MAMPGTETIRFRRPTNKNEPAPEPKKDQFGEMAPQGWKRRHQGLLQDLLRRCVPATVHLPASGCILLDHRQGVRPS